MNYLDLELFFSVSDACVFKLSLFKCSFPQQGTGPEVPKFLRYEGQVRNRRLGKRDTSLLIKDIWQEKAAHDAEVRDNIQGHLFADKLYLYMLLFTCDVFMFILNYL